MGPSKALPLVKLLWFSYRFTKVWYCHHVSELPCEALRVAPNAPKPDEVPSGMRGKEDER